VKPSAASTARSDGTLPGATCTNTGSPAGTRLRPAVTSARPSPAPRAAGATSKAISQRPASPRPAITSPAPSVVSKARTSLR
jgi:hypothetical protein